MCFLALSRSDNRLESFRFGKFLASLLTFFEQGAAEAVEGGKLVVLGLKTDRGNEASWSASIFRWAHVQKSVLKYW